ncbi:MAG TPA: ribose 5-phosphate isomerase B [Candidatus Acidoferrales bacterium]|jgi:RpiB/LacA/LacB family sugar-phosphate isomerase|nr:ribose 5-phosphate isomerase B [Candidatus Acidoferrales bacterium]
MKIAMGSDHAGFELKAKLVPRLIKLGHEVEDLGTYDETPVDYPDYAAAVGRLVIEGRAERGIMICGSGVGATVAANKLPGIRACVCHDTYSAHQGVEHDKMNVLVLGSRVIGDELAFELVENFLSAKFSGEPRHVRRLAKIQALEDMYMKTRASAKGQGNE